MGLKGGNLMELKDTVELMTSKDYKDRFKAEYFQLKIRLEKLRNMLHKWRTSSLDFLANCPYEYYARQVAYMSNYLEVLKERAEIEGIELECANANM